VRDILVILPAMHTKRGSCSRDLIWENFSMRNASFAIVNPVDAMETSLRSKSRHIVMECRKPCWMAMAYDPVLDYLYVSGLL